MKRAFISVLSLAALPTIAASPAGAQMPTTGQMHLDYAAYASGFNVINLRAGFDLSPRSYRLEVAFHTAGIVGALIHAETDSVVAGLWAGLEAEPSRFYSYGHVRGMPRRTQIDYMAGQPLIRILQPVDDGDHESVPPEMERNTVDTLSAIALLVHTLATTGRCDGHVRTFDGRRISEIAVHDGGEAEIEPEHGSAFRGVAHRCDFDGRQLAGFVKDVARADLARPQHGVAWLAPVMSGTAPVPVRMSFHTRFFGDATMYLTAAEQGAELPPQ